LAPGCPRVCARADEFKRTKQNFKPEGVSPSTNQINMIYKESKINSINTLTIEIEEDFNESFSVVAYDSEGFIWIEKFAKTIEQAKKLADKLHEKLS